MLLFFVIIFLHTVFKSLPLLINGQDKFAWTEEMKSLLVNGDWFGLNEPLKVFKKLSGLNPGYY